MSSVLAVEAQAGHLPPELTRPSLAFFFIEGTFYVSDRWVLAGGFGESGMSGREGRGTGD